MRQSVEAKTKVESEPGNNVPVVEDVKTIVVLDPMFARQVLELCESSDISKKEVDIRIFGK